MGPHKARYIAVEGPIGVGKSSLTRLLAREFNARAVMDDPDANPFLPRFYESPSEHAFQTQIYFLLARYRQQIRLKQGELFGGGVVCDYLFSKDALFAGINLSEEELELYRRIHRLLDRELPRPDAVVFLQAGTDVLMRRIRLRNKDYEAGIGAEYVTKVAEAYSRFFFGYDGGPLLVVNVNDLDFMKDERGYAMLKKELDHLVASGKDRHYVTLIGEAMEG